MSTEPKLQTERTATLSMPSDTEIVLTRTFDAPRELVWQAWTDPNHLAHWWGPSGFTLTTRRMEPRPGGQWRFVMHGPDGRDYENLVTYVEVAAPERLVYKHGGDQDIEPVNFQVTVTFERAGPTGEQTRLTMRSVFASKNARDFVLREYGAGEGGKQTLARLGEYVAEMRGESADDAANAVGADRAGAAAGRPFVITRVVRAPRDLVWRVWTEVAHLERWFGPKGVTTSHCRLDLRVGGVFHYCMTPAEGPAHWGRWVFREIVPPERLVFVVSFADEAANAIRAPWDANWPLEMLSTVTFDDHAGIGRGTVVSVRWEAVNASATERQSFAAGHGSMRQGWGGTFERLEGYLQTAAR